MADKTLSQEAAALNVSTPPSSPADVAIRAIYRDYASDLPPGALQAGRWQALPGDRFDKVVPLADIADGTYRIEGSDWLLTFRKNRLVAAEVADFKNQWGGSKVKSVPAEKVV